MNVSTLLAWAIILKNKYTLIEFTLNWASQTSHILAFYVEVIYLLFWEKNMLHNKSKENGNLEHI